MHLYGDTSLEMYQTPRDLSDVDFLRYRAPHIDPSVFVTSPANLKAFFCDHAEDTVWGFGLKLDEAGQPDWNSCGPTDPEVVDYIMTHLHGNPLNAWFVEDNVASQVETVTKYNADGNQFVHVLTLPWYKYFVVIHTS